MARAMVAVVAVCALAACASHKEITLSIDTTAGVPCDIDSIQINATGAKQSTLTRGISTASLPLTITLSDESTDNGFQLDVVGLKADKPVLRKSGKLAFNGDIAYVMLEPECLASLATPCSLPSLVADTAPAPAAAPRYGCGAVARYAQQAGAAVFLDTCNLPPSPAAVAGDPPPTNLTGAVTFGEDLEPVEITDLAPLLAAAKFRFYGLPVQHVWVDRHGYLSVGDTTPDHGNAHTPDAFDVQGHTPPTQAMMVFWDNLTKSDKGVCYSLDGDVGIRTLRVTWSNTCLVESCSPSESLNFTAVLYEHTQRIDFTYGAMTSANTNSAEGATATVGIVNQAPGCQVAQCDNKTGLCKDGKTPCSFIEVFSKAAQTSGVQNVGFEPVFDH
jgi:hypothetical protein